MRHKTIPQRYNWTKKWDLKWPKYTKTNKMWQKKDKDDKPEEHVSKNHHQVKRQPDPNVTRRRKTNYNRQKDATWNDHRLFFLLFFQLLPLGGAIAGHLHVLPSQHPPLHVLVHCIHESSLSFSSFSSSSSRPTLPPLHMCKQSRPLWLWAVPVMDTFLFPSTMLTPCENVTLASVSKPDITATNAKSTKI